MTISVPIILTTQASLDVLSERKRQVDQEGWTPGHDDEHGSGELAEAAACYAHMAALSALLAQHIQHMDLDAIPSPHRWPAPTSQNADTGRLNWPWPAEFWKPGERRRMLVKSAALVLAEIERLDRAKAAKNA